MTREKKEKVVALPLGNAKLLREIRRIAEDKNNIRFSTHAFDRIGERSGIVEITQEDVYKVLRFGDLDGDPRPGKSEGETVATVVYRPKGSRAIGVASVVKSSEDKLFVLTVMWRDA